MLRIDIIDTTSFLPAFLVKDGTEVPEGILSKISKLEVVTLNQI